MDAVTRVPVPYNEPVRQYQPGSADRAALAAKLKELAGQRAELTMSIGGRAVMGSGERVAVVQPHNFRHVLGDLANATDADVAAAIASGHVDDLDAVPDVAAAADAITAADAGDEDASFTVDSAEARELAWYAAQELQYL